MLAIIPARGGSRGVPNKALRTVAGVPLILRTLRCIEASGVADRLVVSTDCPKIKSFCELRGYEVLDRPAELGADDVPLADVARHAVEALSWDGVTVGIFQPTCPLLRPQTIGRVAEAYHSSGADWAITASRDPHIHWQGSALLTERKQRQELGDLLCESGAVQLMSAEVALGAEPACRDVYPIPEREALDIDTPDDLMLAERLCSLRRIHFVVLAPSTRTGTGHFHRSKALAEALSHHEVSWEWIGKPPEWAEGFANRHVMPKEGEADADLIVFDRLSVPGREILQARAEGKRVVVLEDETADATLPDLLVNALLDPADVRYADLRSEFLELPEREHRKDADRVLVSFGGTDPAELGARVARVLCVDLPKSEIRWIVPSMKVRMAEEMRWADLVITGQGRTVFEAAASSTPCISIAANEREARHVRLPGVTYLGLHSMATDDQIRQVVAATLADVELRRENAQAARRVVDGRGLDRLVRRIEELAVS